MKTLHPDDHLQETQPAPAATPTRTRQGGGRISREIRRAGVDPSLDAEAAIADIAPRRHDRVAVFGPVITGARLATTAISLLLAADAIIAGDPTMRMATVIVVAYATLRSLHPVRYADPIPSLIAVFFEVVLHVAVVLATGLWASPFVYTVLTAVIVAGFARGFAFGLRIGMATGFAVSLPQLLADDYSAEAIRVSARWTVLLILISIVTGYGRRISGEADRERDLALDRLSRLADANALLFSLHRVAQSLPASLDMNDVLDSTVARLRGLVEFDSLVVLLFDDTDGQWDVVRNDGVSLPTRVGLTDLPLELRRAISSNTVISCNNLAVADGGGFSNGSGSGLYGVLTARGAIMGLIALECRDTDAFDQRSEGLLEGFVPPLALALDNARWFARLRTVGADEERTRIARDLHDRIGQSLAYLAFETDRIVNRNSEGVDVGPSLDQLRNDIRGVIGEVRDTLYDLRTDVSDDTSLADILNEYIERVSARTGLEITVEADGDHRVPLLQERELWRIVQEAITNTERHAQASRVQITYRCDGERAAVRVTDDGIGFEAGKAGRLDSYGMLGMRERASSIGASLDIKSIQGRGTSVTCLIDPRSRNE